MKLIYIWIENFEDKLINQEICISNSYLIKYDDVLNELKVSKNNYYLNNFYGNNILDLTAIVGKNGVGKTTISRFIYRLCSEVQTFNSEENNQQSKFICIYERKNENGDELVIHYFLPKGFKYPESNDIVIKGVDLVDLKGEKFNNEYDNHNLTTVFFTNTYNVSNNYGFHESNMFGKQKSIECNPIYLMQKSVKELKEHHGYELKKGLLILSSINEYARNMVTDITGSYATEKGYNFLIANRNFSDSIKDLFPDVDDVKVTIPAFGEYVDRIDISEYSKSDIYVSYIRNQCYNPLKYRFENNIANSIYINVLCEIILFITLPFGIENQLKGHHSSKRTKVDHLEMLKSSININYSEDIISILSRIEEINSPDLSLIKDCINIIENESEYTNLKSSKWYCQINDYVNNLSQLSCIPLDFTISAECDEFIDLIIREHNNKESVIRRMVQLKPQGISSGESALIDMFATVFLAMSKEDCGNLLLIIDEIDAYLHPEWQQTILAHITHWINEYSYFKNRKVQLIITTHSPIVLSDVPKDKILYLEDSFKISKKDNLTFGASINNLFYDSFFLNEGSIGSIAKKQIQWAINCIKDNCIKEEEHNLLVYIVENIGDKFLKETLKSYPFYLNIKEKVGSSYDKN